MGDQGGPFLASISGLTTHQLRNHRKLHRNVYVDPRAAPTPLSRARAALLWAGDNGVLAGLSAAAVHGSKWVDADHPAELIRRAGSRRSAPGIRVHTDSPLPDEVESVHGLPVTTVPRTAFDLGRWLPFDEAVAMLDALCNATRIEPKTVAALADRHPGARRIRQLRRVLKLVDGGAESPPETRIRLLLVRAGLPPPSTQVQITDEVNRIVARADLGWRRWRVLVEYDGAQHWADERARTRDIRRYALLARLGWRVVRVNSELLRRCSGEVVAEVRALLREAGADV
ncbi:DUF559 domain-containing protein [Tomitella biformata]|uniref:DUF559 domain-containing protein n=1 Tax=Tomitella biformata TaxID=630403 RepID=UPI0004651FB8|nr:DUF559 domain-containing protein [Tomitella biformata]